MSLSKNTHYIEWHFSETYTYYWIISINPLLLVYLFNVLRVHHSYYLYLVLWFIYNNVIQL